MAVKNAGFNAIRIPCVWDQYLEDQTTYKIKDTWLSRVKEVVDYCVDNENKENNGFALFDRQTGQVVNQLFVDAIINADK